MIVLVSGIAVKGTKIAMPETNTIMVQHIMYIT